MHHRKSLAAPIARIALVLVLLGGIVAIAAPAVSVPGIAVAKNGKGGNNGKGNEKKDEKKDDKPGKGNKDKDKDKGNKGNKGRGNDEEETTPIVIVQAPNTTPSAVTPTPTATAVPLANGQLRLLVRSCGATPVAGADWTSACTAPVPKTRFELTVLDGAFAGWHRNLQTGDDGTVDLAELPAGRYDLAPVVTSWCHAESDRVDPDGRLSIQGGQTTTVWVFTCTSLPAAS